jgi:Undecaprenyl-phosphate glucose phosphotransferase
MSKSDFAFAGRYAGTRESQRSVETIAFAPEMRSRRSLPLLSARALTVVAPVTETAIIALTVFGAWALYHLVLIGELASPLSYATAAGGLAALFSGSSAFARDYSIKRLLARREQLHSIFWRWTLACSFLVFALFMLQMTDSYSRGTMVVQYLAGLATALTLRFIFAHAVARALDRGYLRGNNVVVIGEAPLTNQILRRLRGDSRGTQIAGAFALASPPLAAAVDPLLRDPAQVADETAKVLGEVEALARRVAIDDIVLCLPWSENERIRAFAEGLAIIPATIHLAPDHSWNWTRNPVLARIGVMHTVRISRAPLTLRDRILKRSFDIAAALALLLASAPLLALVAVLIKLDTPGPILFRQRRHGFNQREFRVFKFRTMTTLDDGPVVRQATRNDRRITRVGRYLRSLNLDEVPQLLNVLIGQMSLVGPRPHALTHNNQYEEQIRLYARRHNVKPGITGWAQVNGLRGETQTVDQMRRRIEHDLYYIDHWSLFFDIKILVLTLFSPKTYRNAY